MDMQKYADGIKNNPNKKLKVFPSGKKIVAGLALGAATIALGGTPNVVDATDGRPTEKAVELNALHVVGLLAMGAAGTVAMVEGMEHALSSSKEDKKTKKLSPEEIKAAMAGRNM